MRKIAYLRVSTAEQRPDRQIDGLQGLCDELHIETLSACSKKRPVYDRVIGLLKPGDMLVVWDLDRAFRSVVDALTEAEKLRQRDIHFKIANISIDTTTPAGIFVYTMLSALAEFERRTLSQRTKEGLQAARRRGKRVGRPPTLTDRQVRDARHRIEIAGNTASSVAKEMGVPRWTLSRAIRRQADCAAVLLKLAVDANLVPRDRICYAGTMETNRKTLTADQVAEAKGQRLTAMHLQAIEANPLDAEDVAMFEMFEREAWPHERRRAYILDRARTAAMIPAAE